MLCQVLAAARFLLTEIEQFMGDIEAGKHGNAFQATTAVTIAQLSQLFVEIGSSRYQAGTLFRLAGNQVVAIKNAYANGLAHV